MIFLLIITLFSCKKENSAIGLNLEDNIMQTNVVKDFDLRTSTVYEDSLQTSRLSFNVLGVLEDAEFGKSSASVAFHMRLPSAKFSFGNNFRIDSVVLFCQYVTNETYNGNLNSNIRLKVYELDQRIFVDTAYYSNQKLKVKSSVITTQDIMYNLTDSIKVNENGNVITYPPHLRINLGSNFTQKIQNISAANLISNEAFADFLNGFMLVPDSNQVNAGGAMTLINLRSPLSGIHVYYNDTSKAIFQIGNDAPRINLYSNNVSGAQIEAMIGDTSNSEFGYLKALQGLKIKIEVKDLLKLVTKNNVAIINAQIVFHYDDDAVVSGFPAPERLLLLKRDKNNKNDFVADQLLEAAFYGGELNTDKRSYSFNITREIQAILNQYHFNGLDDNSGFFLIVPTDVPIGASRIKMDTRKNTERGIQFKVSLITP